MRDDDQMNQKVAQTVPLGRVGLPEDIAAAVAALLGDDCGWIDGQRVEVSGGQMV